MIRPQKRRYFALAAGLLLVAGCSPNEAVPTGGKISIARLTPDQFRNAVHDVFGEDIAIVGRPEPPSRESGLRAIGASTTSISPAGLEEYDRIARSIAQQVVDKGHRARLVPCHPASKKSADDDCTGLFLDGAVPFLYRRPVDPAERSALVASAREAASRQNDFYAGLETALSTALISPEFLFRWEVASVDPKANKAQLDPYSKASRLSFFLWNAGPDKALLAAAKSGELDRVAGRERQVSRLMESPRFERGVRAFFSDFLQLDNFESLTKDAKIYPEFTAQVIKDAPEETLRTIIDLLVRQRGDYRDLFTTKLTYLTPALASVYRLPFTVATPNGAPESWERFQYGLDDFRGGILTQVSFVALHSHPGRSSPTLRGRALREILMCQKIPDPPANVNFALVQNVDNPVYRTARDRLGAHATEPSCKGCHKLTDPIGLALENEDSAGARRMTENGAPIDASGMLDNAPYSGPAELARAVHDHPAVPACLAERLFSYAVNRQVARGQAKWMDELKKHFAEDHYRFVDLVRRIATSEAFYQIDPPENRPVTAQAAGS